MFPKLAANLELNLKRIICALLIFSLVLVSAVQIGLVSAAEPTEKKMMHYSRDSAWQRLLQKVDTNLEADVEYTVSFNSKFVNGALGNNIYFNLYGHTSGDFSTTESKPLRFSKSRSSFSTGKLFESETIYGANTTYTFKLTSSEIANITEYYIGFYFAGAAADFYLGDFVLYKSNDSTKTNLLKNSDSNLSDSTHSDWYNNYKNNWNNTYVTFEAYNATFFPIPTKTMLHAVRTYTSENKLVLKLEANTLKADTEYTVSFNSKFVSNSLNTKNFFGIFGETSKDMNADTTLRASKVFSGHTVATTFDTEVTNGANTQYTFKLTANEISGYTAFYVGFYLYGANDFYVGDFALYESADVNKTNLLPKDDMANEMSGWCNNYSKAADGAALFAESEYVTYDETYFPIPTKTMLHAVRTYTSENKLVLKLNANTLKADTEYTVSFNSKFVSNTLNTKNFFGIFGETSKDMNADTTLRASKVFSGHTVATTFDSEVTNGANTQYTFKLTANEISGYTAFYVGFYLYGANDFYVGDFALYESADTNKTNLLPKDDMANEMSGWCNNYSKAADGAALFAESEYVTYDETYFPIPTKTMLHVVRTYSSENKLVLKLNANTLKADTEYTVSFNSKFVTKSLNTQNFFGVFGETSKDMNADTTLRASKVFSGHTKATTFDTEVTNGANSQYTFKLTADEIAGYTAFYVGFYLYGANDFYVGDFALYESADVNKTNLLPKDDMANEMSGWCNNYSKAADGAALFAESEYVTYDETYFPIPTKTMLHAVRTISSENKLVLKLDANTLQADTEYTIFFKHKFVSRALNNNVYFGLFGETTAEMYADKMIYASAKHGKEFTTAKEDDITATYTFTLTADEIAQYTDFYVGFYFDSSSTPAEFYVADFVMYQSLDTEKANLLPKNEYSNEMSSWYNNYNNGAGSEYPTVYASSQYVPYDDSYFPIPETPVKTMFNIKRVLDSENKLMLKLKSGTIEAGSEYTIEYKYHFDGRNLDRGVYFVLMGDKDGKAPWADTFFKGSSKYGESFTSQYKDGAFAKFTFTLNAEQLASVQDVYVGFYFSALDADADFYIADFVMYKSADQTKTNLLPKHEYSTDKNGWYNDYNNDTVSKYVPYDETIFVADADENLYGDPNLDDGVWWKPEDVVEVDTRGTATIKGTLKEQNGTALSNIKLVVVGEEKEYSAVTNDKGAFVFKNIISAYYDLFIIDNNQELIPTGYSVHLGNGDIASVNIVCDTSNVVINKEPVPAGVILGTVYTPELKTIANMKIYLRNYGETVTDSNGNFGFNDVPVGNYELYTVLDDGSEYIFRAITVKEDIELKIKLKYDVTVDETQGDNNRITNWIWIVVVGSALLIAAGIFVLVFIKKKKV